VEADMTAQNGDSAFDPKPSLAGSNCCTAASPCPDARQSAMLSGLHG
jgi:hypothetical protein